MGEKHLGETFDIHAGGIDLQFPHHENEIAQSECCHGRPQARYWLHNGLMQASDEIGKVGGRQTRSADDAQQQLAGKISKSKGSGPFRELLNRHAAETIRFFLLSTHYRRPIDFSEERIGEVGAGLEQFYRYFARYRRVAGRDFYALSAARLRSEGDFDPGPEPALQALGQLRTRFLEAMDDDFNTGGATGVLFELIRLLNKLIDDHKLETPGGAQAAPLSALERGTSILRELAGTLGLFRAPLPAASDGGDELLGGLMQLLVELRAEARGKKDFALADRIRRSLSELGVTLEDRPHGTDWTRAK
jgi:cysteinyl-tRNA synthetase